jgi:hypothetical protein
MEILLKHSDSANLAASILILLTGLVVLRFALRPGPPHVFQQHPFMVRPYVFWLLQWAAFVLIWTIHPRGSPSQTQLQVLLAAVDLQSLLVFGFVFAFLDADRFRWQSTAVDLAIIYLLLLVWNFGVPELSSVGYFSEVSDAKWILASEVASALAFTLMAVIFVLRYRASAIFFTISLILYIVLQRPIYRCVFVEKIACHEWALALAGGKLLFAAFFYNNFFFIPARTYDPIDLPSFYLQSPRLQKIARAVLLAIIGLILEGSTSFASKLLSALLKMIWR